VIVRQVFGVVGHEISVGRVCNLGHGGSPAGAQIAVYHERKITKRALTVQVLVDLDPFEKPLGRRVQDELGQPHPSQRVLGPV